jgi:hypothetical protein
MTPQYHSVLHQSGVKAQPLHRGDTVHHRVKAKERCFTRRYDRLAYRQAENQYLEQLTRRVDLAIQPAFITLE